MHCHKHYFKNEVFMKKEANLYDRQNWSILWGWESQSENAFQGNGWTEEETFWRVKPTEQMLVNKQPK